MFVLFCVAGYLNYEIRLMAADNRDLVRLAVFFMITPRFAALSSALYAFGSKAIASSFFLSVTKMRRFFTASFIARFLRRLNTRFLPEALNAFFAELVIAI